MPPQNEIGTGANEEEFLLRFVSFCSRQIRVIREIRGKTFAKMSDFGVSHTDGPGAASRNQSEDGGWRMEETGELSEECLSGE